MAFHNDLLKQAVQLAHNEVKKPKQASLRRAVSTAYYALFHFLIHEAVSNWSHKESRVKLGRAFDHRLMKSACNRFQKTGEQELDRQIVSSVAKTFIRLQDKRHIADYNNSTFWSRTEALREVKAVQQAFEDWKLVRKTDRARDFLLSLLLKQREA